MMSIFAVLCRWAYVRKYGQLTDITGQPISRASSASSAQAFQQRPRAVDRSLTCDSDLSGSSSGSEGEGEGEDMIPAGQFQDGSASRKKTGGSALGQHSAKPQSACKPCRFQQCCMLFPCSDAFACIVPCQCFSQSPFIACHEFCVCACFRCCLGQCCGLRVFHVPYMC